MRNCYDCGSNWRLLANCSSGKRMANCVTDTGTGTGSALVGHRRGPLHLRHERACCLPACACLGCCGLIWDHAQAAGNGLWSDRCSGFCAPLYWRPLSWRATFVEPQPQPFEAATARLLLLMLAYFCRLVNASNCLPLCLYMGEGQCVQYTFHAAGHPN